MPTTHQRRYTSQRSRCTVQRRRYTSQWRRCTVQWHRSRTFQRCRRFVVALNYLNTSKLAQLSGVKKHPVGCAKPLIINSLTATTGRPSPLPLTIPQCMPTTHRRRYTSQWRRCTVQWRGSRTFRRCCRFVVALNYLNISKLAQLLGIKKHPVGCANLLIINRLTATAGRP